MFSTSGTTGVSGSSPGKRDVQYLLLLLNSTSQAARATTSGAAYPRASGECWRRRARPSQWSECPGVMETPVIVLPKRFAQASSWSAFSKGRRAAGRIPAGGPDRSVVLDGAQVPTSPAPG